MREIKRLIPSALTAVRLALILPLVSLINSDRYFLGAAMFFFLVSTDLFDGYLARRLGVSSKFGSYFDVTADFVLVFSLFAAFISKGFCADWVLFVVAAVFVEFVLTSRCSTEIYDPVGKHYGSMLFGLIALRFFLSGQLFFDIVTVCACGFSVVSILSRANFIVARRKNECWLVKGRKTEV